MALAVVRSLSSARSRRHGEDEEEFEQELIDQYAIACAAAGTTDESVAQDRAAVFEFVRFLGRRLWSAVPDDADGYLSWLRGARGLARSTVQGKAGALARFYEFVISRYQGDIHALFGCVVVQPIDEFNRPTNVANNGAVRVPPSDEEVRVLFEGWRDGLDEARKFLPAARDYLAASLWRRVGLRINETVMLDVRDWRPELGELGKLHIRFGKGSRGRGAKTRMVPAINDVAALIDWWLVEVRHQFSDDWDAPDAPMFPSERRDSLTGRCARVGAEALRAGLSGAVDAWLPAWSSGRLGPHGLRHYCASSLYQRGVDLKAIQELLGHEWLSTTTKYIHVHDGHVEASWAAANARVTARFSDQER